MRPHPRFELSGTQLLATALAAITATVAASYLGVTGTVIGAALASMLTATGTAVYTHSLHRTRARMRAGMQKSRMHAIAIGSVALFATVLALVTGVELVAGRPLSDLVRGDTGSGTTVFGTTTKNAADQEPVPAPTVTQTVTPSVVVVTPTVTRTAPAVTETAAPTATPSPTSSGTSSGSSGTPAPSDQPTP